MSMPPAIRMDSSTIARASRVELFNKARAAARAYGPPEPIARTPSSGSTTSPVPEMTKEESRSATASRASSRLSTRSVLQSLANSTAARFRLPRYSSILASNFSNKVKASAVAPAKPAKTWSWCKRRSLRALLFMTVVPTVTWPSEPMATRPSRLTQRMVVERIFMAALFHHCSECQAPSQPAGGHGHRRPSVDPSPGVCTFGSWSERHGLASPGSPGGLRPRRGGAWQTNGEAREDLYVLLAGDWNRLLRSVPRCARSDGPPCCFEMPESAPVLSAGERHDSP